MGPQPHLCLPRTTCCCFLPTACAPPCIQVHLVLGAGRTEGAMDAGNLLKPALARGQLRCIGATTLAEYRQHIEKDAAFERRFQQVHTCVLAYACYRTLLPYLLPTGGLP